MTQKTTFDKAFNQELPVNKSIFGKQFQEEYFTKELSGLENTLLQLPLDPQTNQEMKIIADTFVEISRKEEPFYQDMSCHLMLNASLPFNRTDFLRAYDAAYELLQYTQK